MPHEVHGLSSAPSGRCTVWECARCGPVLILADPVPVRAEGLSPLRGLRGHREDTRHEVARVGAVGRDAQLERVAEEVLVAHLCQ